jgi:F-type H+-transporting ATPase subunit epsilon
MAGDKITVEIVTPKGRALREEVDDVAVPSAGGEVGILAGHLPLAAALRAGIVTLRTGGAEKKLAVGEGFVEVKDDEVRVLTDRVAARDQVDPVKVRLDLKDVGGQLERYSGPPGSAEWQEMVAREQWAAVQLELCGDPPHPVRRPADETRAADAAASAQDDAG